MTNVVTGHIYMRYYVTIAVGYSDIALMVMNCDIDATVQEQRATPQWYWKQPVWHWDYAVTV